MMMIKWKTIIISILFLFLLPAVAGAAEGGADLTLEEAVSRGLERNSRVYQSNKDLEISKLNYVKALALALPKVSLKYDYSHLRYRYEQEKTVSVAGMDLTAATPRDFDFNTASLNINQAVFNGGREWFLFFGAFDTVRLNEAVVRRAEQEVIFDVKKAYYQALSLESAVEVMKKALLQTREHLKIARALAEQGMVVKTDVLRAELGLAAAKRNLIRAENGVKVARASLNFLIDEDVDSYFNLVDDDTPFDSLKSSYEECVELALRFRPEIQQMRSRLAVAQKNVWVNRADYLPGIRLFYNHKLEGGLMVKDDPDHWDDTSEEESWIAGGVVELKLFNGGQTRAAVREAKINLNKAQRQRADLNKKIKLEVLSAYSNAQESLARSEAQAASEAQAEENYRIVELQYKEGLVQSVNVMEAHTALLNTQTESLSARFDYRLALAELEKAVGLKLSEGEFVNEPQK